MVWKPGSQWWVRIADTYLTVLIVYFTLWTTFGETFWPVFIMTYVTPWLVLPAPFLFIIMLRQQKRWRALALVLIILAFLWPLTAWLSPSDIDSTTSPTVQFTVLTYNVGNGLAAPDRLVELLRASDADIIGLQELTSTQAEAISEALTDEYPHQALFGLGIPGKGLLSRFPINDVEQLRFDPDRLDLKAIVNIKCVPISVIIAHPEPPRFQPTGFHFTSRTLNQIDSLVEAATSNGPTIMMGDFNFTERHQAYHQLIGAGLLDAFRSVSHRPGYTIPARLWGIRTIPIMRIDYVWATAHFRSLEAWVGPDAGSDHLPVIARLAGPALGSEKSHGSFAGVC